jgi:hypothetical protein
MVQINSTAPNSLSQNQETYQCLKQALSLGLRRQIFIGICDNINLRDRYLYSLEREICISFNEDSPLTKYSNVFVIINLNLEFPNFWEQINHWFKQNQGNFIPEQKIYFQIIGIEKLTKQTAQIQRYFFNHLPEKYWEKSSYNIDYNLILWIPRPWLYSIQKSSPEFWSWHTGVFEFEGEPTPVTSAISQPESNLNVNDSHDVLTRENMSYNLGEYSGKNLSQNYQEIEKIKVYDDEDLTFIDETIFDPTGEKELGNLIIENKLNNNYNELLDQDYLTDLTEEDLESVTAEILGQDMFLDEDDFDLLEDLSENEIDQGEIKDQVTQIPTQENTQDKENSFENQSLCINTLEDLENLDKLNYPREIITTACFQLAYKYRDLIASGEVTKDNLKIAISAYQKGLQNLPEDDQNLPELLNDLGNLYWMLSRQTKIHEEIVSLLNISIQSYQLALLKIKQFQLELEEIYAMIHNNLGAVYNDLAKFNDPETNLQFSIDCYQNALKYGSKEKYPLKYGSTQNNLGTTYWHLSQLTKSVTNLKSAITSYEEALNQYSPEIYPLNWAMIQNNIGTAYWNLSQYENTEEWLNCAVDCYQKALKYRTAENAPSAYAATQNNLGTAYWHLAETNLQNISLWHSYLQRAITAYEIAIYFVDLLSKNQPPISVNFEFLVTLNNLGLINYQIATNPELNLSLEEKNRHFDLALVSHGKVLDGENSNSANYQTAFNAIIKIVRIRFEQEGFNGQNLALGKIPANLLPEVLSRL